VQYQGKQKLYLQAIITLSTRIGLKFQATYFPHMLQKPGDSRNTSYYKNFLQVLMSLFPLKPKIHLRFV